MIGAFLEMGPFNVVNASYLEYKSVNWLLPGANMVFKLQIRASNFFLIPKVFIDQPACVGFSYSTNLNDCNTSDTQAASVNIRAIKKFLHNVMPRYKVWFFKSVLASLVVDDKDLNSNFVGFMVGNPVMECFDKVCIRSFQLSFLRC